MVSKIVVANIVIDKIILGNIITIITFILTIVANTIINRRKHLKMWVFINSVDCIAWAILGSWQGSVACLYPVLRHSFLLWKYKEEKIVVEKWVSIITCVPYIFIGLIELKNGMSWRVFAGIVNFINAMTFMIYRDDTRFKVEGVCDIYYLVYGLYYRNYGEVLRNVVEMTQFGINIIRLKLNGEKKYYKDKRNVCIDNGIIDIKKIYQYNKDNLVRIAEEGDLIQVNYTTNTMYNNLWDDITLNTRGHIYNKRTGKIVCPAMSKFFNYGDLSDKEKEELSKREDYIATKKYDGSMGLIYKYQGKLRYNSRGGFYNQVTKEISKILGRNKELKEKLEGIDENISLSVEVISPATRVITNYGEIEELVLITCFEKNDSSYKELDFDKTKEIGKQLGLKVIEEIKMSVEELIKWCKVHKGDEEGFVIRYSDNTRVKFKSKDYVDMANFKCQLQENRLLNYTLEFYMNPNIEWKDKNIECKKVLEEKVMSMPDELYEKAREEVNKIVSRRNEIYAEIEKEYKETAGMSNKEIGISKYKYKDQIFGLRIGRIGDVERYIIKRIIKENNDKK